MNIKRFQYQAFNKAFLIDQMTTDILLIVIYIDNTCFFIIMFQPVENEVILMRL